MTISLLDEVARLMDVRPRALTYEIIAEKTGVSMAKLSRLNRLKGGGVPVDDVQTVYEFLSGKPLIGN